VEFYKSDEKYLGKSYIDFGLPPDLKSQSSWDFMKSEGAKQLGEAVAVGRTRPITPVWTQIDDAIAVAVGKVCAGEATAEAALAEAEKKTNEALASL
jgi:ABC-type glycerol-3-phosphate transport system substrate-binding protein